MKRLILFLIIFYPISGFNQTAEDSLLAQIEHIGPQEREDIYYQLYLMFRESDPKKSLDYAYKNLEHTQKYNDIDKQIRSYRIVGIGNHNINRFDTSEKYLKKAEAFARRLNYNNELITILGNLGILNSKRNNYIKSVKYYLEYIKLTKEINNTELLAAGYNNIGLVYYRMGDIQTALKFYIDCIETKERYDIFNGLFVNYNNIGLCFIKLKEFDKAFNAFNYVIKNIKNKEFSVDSNITNIANAYYGLGNSYYGLGKNEKAINIYKFTIRLIENSYNLRTLSNCYYQLASIYFEESKLDSSLCYAEKCLEFYESKKLSITPEPYILLSSIHENLGNTKKALIFNKQYIHFKDSLLSNNTFANVKNLLIDYQLAENEEIMKVKEIQITRNRQFVYMLIILTISLSILLLFYYRNIKIRKKLNDKLSNLVYQRTIELNSFFYRISHDLAGPVATIKGLLGLFKIDIYKDDIPDFINRMDKTNHRLEDIIKKLNTVSKINSKTLEYENVDIKGLISEILQTFRMSDNSLVDIQLHGNRMFRTDKTLLHIILYNILLNSIQYIDHREVRHEVKIDIRNNGKLNIVISDNGKGIELKYSQKIFDLFYVANDNSKGNGLGLYQAKLAVQRLKGTIELTNHKKPVTFCISVEKPRKNKMLSNNTIAFS